MVHARFVPIFLESPFFGEKAKSTEKRKLNIPNKTTSHLIFTVKSGKMELRFIICITSTVNWKHKLEMETIDA